MGIFIALIRKLILFLNLLSRPQTLLELLRHGHQGFLYEVGWIRSFESKTPVDRMGAALPWMTYPMIEFLKARIRSNWTVFEYGSGYSTCFFSKNSKFVYTIDHNEQWTALVQNNLLSQSSDNYKLYTEAFSETSKYANSIQLVASPVDLVIVDGVHRNECIVACLSKLNAKGVIILDDSERDEYQPGVDLLARNGFKALEFWGFSPGLFYRKCSTLYYRQENLFDI